MNTAIQVAPLIGIGVARATFYRAQRAVSARRPRARRVASLRALSAPERHTILEVLHAPAYADLSPRTVFVMLLDAGRYLLGVHLLPAAARRGRGAGAAQ